ncbi:MAG: metalloregulator ArsR/SmtB family transcription factor [Pseudomonadota bacterium]
MMAFSDEATCADDAHPPRADFTPPPGTTLESAAAMLRAAGDPARLLLLLRLAEGERCVSELAEAEGEKLATVSARLQLLHNARLVRRRREAKHVHYALADHHVARLLTDILEHAAEDHSHAKPIGGTG